MLKTVSATLNMDSGHNAPTNTLADQLAALQEQMRTLKEENIQMKNTNVSL